jgi:hypothetical protein
VGGVKYANIGLAVGMSILFGGALLLRNAGDGALQALMLVVFIVTFAVYHGLDERDKRRRRRRRRDQ